MTPEQEVMLKETHEAALAAAQVLRGYNGKSGLIEDFEAHKKADAEFRREFYKFKTWVYVMVAFAAGGGGAIGAGLSRFFSG